MAANVMTSLVALLVVMSVTSCLAQTDCGFLLRPSQSPDNDTVPTGWTLCYLDDRDVPLYVYTCNILLQGLRGIYDSNSLMAAGGNYGCWNLLKYPDSAVANACRNNFQHSIKVEDCFPCTAMAVCIRFPTAEEKAEAQGKGKPLLAEEGAWRNWDRE